MAKNWKLALRVLRDGLTPPESVEVHNDRYVLGEPVDLYAVKALSKFQVGYRLFYDAKSYHATCAEAFAEAGPGERVDKVRCYRNGDDYYAVSQLSPITFTPKPKRAKGRR